MSQNSQILGVLSCLFPASCHAPRWNIESRVSHTHTRAFIRPPNSIGPLQEKKEGGLWEAHLKGPSVTDKKPAVF